MIRVEIGARVRAVVEATGLPQRVVAERCGIAQGYLSEVSSGKKLASVDLLANLVAEFGADPAALLLAPRPGGVVGERVPSHPPEHDRAYRLLAGALEASDPARISAVELVLDGLASQARRIRRTA